MNLFRAAGLLLMLFPGFVFGAKLEGYVRDAESGFTLPGATVMVKGTTIGTTSDLDGYYELKDIPSGFQTIVVRFIGYQDLEFTLEIAEKAKYKKNFSLVLASTKLQEVVVNARAGGQVRTLKEQREAESIVTLVDAEQIVSFPDLNAADAIQRVAGITLQRDQGEGRYVQLRGTPPEFTNFNVNGIQLPSPESSIRTVGMDIINASQIQTIEVAKVLRPDMNGDAIGGTVNLITKRAEDPNPQFNVTLAGGFNALRNTPNGEAQFTFSQRKGRIGFLVNANYNRSIQGADNMEFKYEKGVFFGDSGPDNFHIQYTEVQLRHYDIDRERTGLSATLDYQIDENHTIFVNGMYNNFTDDETRRRKVYTLDDALSERTYLFGGIEHDLKDRVKIQNITTVSIGGDHNFRKFNLDYEIALSTATESQPDRMEAVFENPGQAITMRWDVSDPDFPTVIYPDPDNAQNAFAYDEYDLDQLLFENHTAKDQNVIGRMDLEIPFKHGKNHGYFKVGTLLRGKDKSRDIRAQSYGAYFPDSRLYPLPGDTLSLATVSGDFYEDNLLDRGYVMEYMPDPDEMRDFYQRFPTLFVYGDQGITETLERSYAQDYTATEDVQAYYGMATYNINKLMLLAGLRYEHTKITYEGYQIFLISSGYFDRMDTVRDERIQEFFLPNFQLRYSINPYFNVRAALTYSYARPNFRDVIPYRVQNERTEVRLGNPDIQYPFATNYDLLVERYWKGRNMISGGVFYKNIDNFIFNYQVFGYEGDPRESNYSKVQIELPINGQSAFVSGFEFQLQTFFNQLPGHWSNLGVYTNYTYTYSEGTINKRFPANDNINVVQIGGDYSEFFDSENTEVIPLPGQAPHALNLALFYDSPKIYVKASLNFNDSYLHTLGVDPDLDEYYGAQWRMDINGYYQINEVVQVFGDVRNVTNTPLRYYLGKPENERILQTEYYSYWARLGVRLTF
ncbi:MAG: TonB-dependent receptor [Leptolyngbya sp. SIO3F4]|nr:TonB-dependent receptor [Leptolyngbya sp. SIO3F4]